MNGLIDSEPTYIVPKWIVVVVSLLPWFLGGFILIWILFLRFPLDGVFQVQGDLTGDSAFILPFLPSERVSSPGLQEGGWVGQRVLDDPVYMNVITPGPYENIEVEMEFRPLRQSLIEFGLIRDSAGSQLEMHSWYSEILEQKEWQQVTNQGEILGYVAGKVPEGRLTENDTRGLGVWLASTTSPFMMDIWNEERPITKVSFRGAHDFWVVPADGKIYFKLEIQDVNRNRSGGLMALQVLLNDEIILQDAVGTSGSRDVGYGALIPVIVNLKDLKSGVYRIRVLGDDDVFIRRVTTNNPRWVVGPRLVIGDVVGYATTTNPLKAWTTARHIVVETFHKEGFQEVALGEAKGTIRRTHIPVRIDRTDDVIEPVIINAPNGDIRVISDGYFAFSANSFFEPQPRKLTAATLGVKEGIEAILTSYQRVESLEDGWMKARYNFTVPKDASTLRFVLSAPGIASRAGSVDIRKVTATFRRNPISLADWWNLIYQEAKFAWKRIK